MKRFIITAGLLLTLCAAAQAVTAVYAEVTYPTTTTWKLWLTECNWTGSLPIVPSGLGISGFAIEIIGAESGRKAMPSAVELYDDQDPPVDQGRIGFPIGMDPADRMYDVTKCFAAQDIMVPNGWFFGFGVSAGAYTPPGGWTTTAPYQFDAPGAPLSANPGALVYVGTRNPGAVLSINWGEVAKANVFVDGFTYSGTPNIQTVPVVPEPATLALLVLASLAAMRRRR